MDPGYSTADEIAAVQRLESDVFSEQRRDQHLADIWPRHLGVLKWETALHSLAIGCPLLGWGLAKLGRWLPAMAVLALWLVVLCVEYGWAALAIVFRRALMRSSWAEFDASFERHCLGKSVSLWRRPVVWLVFPIVLRWRRRRSAAAIQAG